VAKSHCVEERVTTILVTGATGNVGAEVVVAALSRSEPVRALVRASDDASIPDGAERAEGDLNDAESFGAAFENITSVFLLAGYDTDGVIKNAERAGVRRIVLLSAGAVDGGDPDNAVVAFNVASERAVQASKLDWAILRPSGYMSNALRWIPQLRNGDTVQAPFGGVPVACIDPADIGAVAARALTESQHVGQTYRLTGPTPLVPAEQVAVLARVLRRPLKFQAQSDDVAYSDMLASMPRAYADAFRSFFVEGTYNDAHVRPTVRDLTGHEPRTFDQWAVAHAKQFD
jgi:uncharacterized protein YbjT (DUF2867 family)